MDPRISIKPSVHFGKPCIAGTRIPVRDVLELLRDGISFPDIITNFYPDIAASDISACIQYAIDVLAIEDIHLAPSP